MSTETKNELLLRVASEMEQELSATGFETVLPILVPFSDEEARAIARVLREAAEGWRPISEEARKHSRILLGWKPFGGGREHVELGWWSEAKQAWVNTYGHPFSGDPNVWAPLPAIALPAPPSETGNG